VPQQLLPKAPRAAPNRLGDDVLSNVPSTVYTSEGQISAGVDVRHMGQETQCGKSTGSDRLQLCDALRFVFDIVESDVLTEEASQSESDTGGRSQASPDGRPTVPDNLVAAVSPPASSLDSERELVGFELPNDLEITNFEALDATTLLDDTDEMCVQELLLGSSSICFPPPGYFARQKLGSSPDSVCLTSIL